MLYNSGKTAAGVKGGVGSVSFKHRRSLNRRGACKGTGIKDFHLKPPRVMASNPSVLLLVLCALSSTQAQLRVFNLRASKLPSDLLGTTDGYVKVSCGETTLGKTAVRRDTVNPWWEEEFAYFHAQANDSLRLEVLDDDPLFDDLLGVCQRQIQFGTHNHDCFLEKGGTLHYSYTLDQ